VRKRNLVRRCRVKRGRKEELRDRRRYRTHFRGDRRVVRGREGEVGSCRRLIITQDARPLLKEMVETGVKRKGLHELGPTGRQAEWRPFLWYYRRELTLTC